jgi:hypothetical protein
VVARLRACVAFLDAFIDHIGFHDFSYWLIAIGKWTDLYSADTASELQNPPVKPQETDF